MLDHTNPSPPQGDTTPAPNRTDIERHLQALFPIALVQQHPGTWIEIAYADPTSGGIDKARHFSPSDIVGAVDFAEKQNKDGFNIYVGAALRRGETPDHGRASDDHAVTANHCWGDFDDFGDEGRVKAILMEKDLKPSMVVYTGQTPHPRFHPYVRFKGNVTKEELRQANKALQTSLGGRDDVSSPAQAPRLAGTVNYPTAKKIEKGYIPELITLHFWDVAPGYTFGELITRTGPAKARVKRSKVAPMPPMPPELAELLESYGPMSSSSPSDSYAPASPQEIRFALASIHPDNFDQFDRAMIAGALYDAFGDDGIPDWRGWITGGKHDPRKVMPQWRKVAKRDGYNYTAKTIFRHAYEADPSWRQRYLEQHNIEVEGEGLTDDAILAVLDELPAPTNDEQPVASDNTEQATPPPNNPPPRPDPNNPPKPDPTMFELHWHGDKSDRPIREWLVKELIFEKGTGLMSGQWGMAKTFVALDLAASVMTKIKFAGREIVRQGGVLFIAAEGQSEMRPRLEGLVERKLRPLADLGERAGCPMDVNLGDLPFAWIEDIPNMQNDTDFTKLAKTAKHMAQTIRAKFDLPLALIIVDTMSVVGHFKDADDTAENQLVMNRLSALGKYTGAFVMTIDHFGKSVETGTRNSSTKEGHVDGVLALLGERKINGDISNTRMALRKLRGGKTGIEFPFELKIVDIDAGETTCIVEWKQEAAGGLQPAKDDRWPRTLKVFKAAMETKLGTHGKTIRSRGDDGGAAVKATPEAEVRREFMATWPAEPDAKRKAYNSALKLARSKELIRSREISGIDYVWQVEFRAPDVVVDADGAPIGSEDLPF